MFCNVCIVVVWIEWQMVEVFGFDVVIKGGMGIVRMGDGELYLILSDSIFCVEGFVMYVLIIKGVIYYCVVGNCFEGGVFELVDVVFGMLFMLLYFVNVEFSVICMVFFVEGVCVVDIVNFVF